MIGADEFVLYERRSPPGGRRRRVGDEAVIWVGRSRLVGRITYVDRLEGWLTAWVRVPMLDVPLPGLTSLVS